jgi:hypothetical protein
VDRSRGGHADPGVDRGVGGHGHHQRCGVSHRLWPWTRGRAKGAATATWSNIAPYPLPPEDGGRTHHREGPRRLARPGARTADRGSCAAPTCVEVSPRADGRRQPISVTAIAK